MIELQDGILSPLVERVTNAHIRWMIRRDMPQVLGIEEQSFDKPWEEADFLQCLRQRNCIGMVAEEYGNNDNLIAYMIYELNKYHLDILKFAVHPRYRRRYVGAQMVLKLISRLSSHRRQYITITRSAPTYSSFMFLSDCGFFPYDNRLTTEDQYLLRDRSSLLVMRWDKLVDLGLENTKMLYLLSGYTDEDLEKIIIEENNLTVSALNG